MTAPNWPFDQAPDVAAATTSAVLAGSPILLVVHYTEDHSWAFLDGSPFDISAGRMISMQEALQLDFSLHDIADLQPGWSARRANRNSAWHRDIDPVASTTEA